MPLSESLTVPLVVPIVAFAAFFKVTCPPEIVIPPEVMDIVPFTLALPAVFENPPAVIFKLPPKSAVPAFLNPPAAIVVSPALVNVPPAWLSTLLEKVADAPLPIVKAPVLVVCSVTVNFLLTIAMPLLSKVLAIIVSPSASKVALSPTETLL